MSEEERLFTWKHDTWCSIVNVIEKKKQIHYVTAVVQNIKKR